MCFPFRRRGAAIAGVIAALAVAPLPWNASAGVVTPSQVEATATPVSEASPISQESASLPAPAITGDAPQFWYPGIKDGTSVDSISLSSVPVHAADMSGAGTLAGAQQHPLIPLPGAAWTGMAGLLGLAAIKVARNFRKLLA